MVSLKVSAMEGEDPRLTFSSLCSVNKASASAKVPVTVVNPVIVTFTEVLVSNVTRSPASAVPVTVIV